MTTKSKKLKALASHLAELSRGSAGEIEEACVRSVLAEAEKAFPPRILRTILKFFYAEIARELRFSEARIEFAGTPLPGETAQALAAHFSKIYSRTIAPAPAENPQILGGLRVQVGDDVYDASLAGTLAKLRRSLLAPCAEMDSFENTLTKK